MKFTHIIRTLAGTAGCLFFLSAAAPGQTYSFKNYGTENNIPSGFVYTITQSDDGYLWVGTGNGLSRFDGYNFFTVSFPDTSVMRYPTSCIKDKNGILWFGCNDGTVYYSRKNSLVQVDLPNNRIISSIMESPDGLIYVLPQGEALFVIDPARPEQIRRMAISGNPVMLSAVFARNGDLLIGTQDNLLICKTVKDSVVVTSIVEGFEYSAVVAVIPAGDDDHFIVGTDGSGLFLLNLAGSTPELSRFLNHPELQSISVQSLMKDSDNNIWISTYGTGALQLSLSPDLKSVNNIRTYNIESGFVINDIKTVFQDAEGNYWLGTYGEGISMLTSYAFGYFSPGEGSVKNNIIYITSSGDNYLLGTPAGFHLFDPVAGRSVSFTDLSAQVGKAEITSYFLDSQENLWIGTGGNGLYVRMKPGKVEKIFRSGDSGSDFIKDIVVENQNIWLATTNGVIVLDKKTAREKERFDINNGLPHNSIEKLMVTSEGDVLVGTEGEKLYKVDSALTVVPMEGVMSGSTINKVLSFSEGKDGVIWAATKSNGVFRFHGDSIVAINRSDDLLSNYCYGILADSENNIWIGHEKGFSRFNPEKGTIRIYGTDFIKGGTCNPGAMFESADKKIFIGTTDGLIVYDRQKERKIDLAPFTNINYIMINDTRYEPQPSFILPYAKRYVIRISYTGISFTSPDKVYYSTYLENYDNDWSKLTTSREAPYSLRDGKYRFNLLAVNEDGMSQESPVSFDITIKQPFWRTWWFLLLSFAAVSAAVIVIIREREKAQKKIQEYLETELEARTKVVVKQKAEIELQNIEITDSINYAKRIQTSILPDIIKLKESFRDAFILYQPKDIVSGDFYWFDRISEDRFIIVCADSTGHGVPGAFMSMIGSTLLQDIVTRKGISRPSEILSVLDKQLFSTLNQNVELGVSNDGMDMVVCDFNIKTRHLRFASAMRPVVIMMGGESYYIKGNRSSIGGESVNDKFFDDQEYYLSQDDAIYLFSDGISDQFGGPDGKKMKIARLKRLIEQVCSLPMEEQKKAIFDYYNEWRANYEQVDDILMMGIRL